MAKSPSAESIQSISTSETLPLDRLTELFQQPALLSRLPETDSVELLLRGALFTLEQDGSAHAVDILHAAAHFCPLASIRSHAVLTLGRLSGANNQAAGDALYALAVHQGSIPAIEYVQNHPIPASRPELQAVYFLLSGRHPEYRQLDPDFRLVTRFIFDEAAPDLQERMLSAAAAQGMASWRIITLSGLHPAATELQALHAQFGRMPESEKQLALEVIDRAAKAGSLLAREAVCQLFIDFEFAPARSLALSQGYTPVTSVQKALFYFLAEHWQIYEYLDFNQTLLASAYEAASPNLRKRILFLSRYSGHTEWMNGLSATSRQRWLWDMNDADWEQAIRNLNNTQHFGDLWRLGQVASPVWSAHILGMLAVAGWQPELPEEKEGFNRLQELRVALENSAPPVSHLQTWPSPSPNIACLALSHDGSYLAVGGANSTIHLWGIYKSPSPLPPLIGPAPQSRAMAFSPDGEYLVVANGDQNIRAFRLSDGKLVKTFEGHTALIRSLTFAPDGRTLFSASFDNSLRAWRFPQGPETKRIETGKSELFGLAVSPDGQILLSAGAGQKLTIHRWPDGDLLWDLAGHTNTITSLVSVPRGQLCATAARDGTIILWNYIAGRIVSRLPSEGQVTALAFHPNEQFILGATAQGNINFWNVSTSKKIESISAHRNPVAGLLIAPDGQQAYSASVDGTLSIWDLQVFTWSRTPIGSNRSQTLAQIEQRGRQVAQKPGERSWLQYIAELIRWRQRFDVEVEETHQVISVGEFDIEL
jgi:WD40 repeat protein